MNNEGVRPDDATSQSGMTTAENHDASTSFPPAIVHPVPVDGPTTLKLIDAQRSFDVGGAVIPALRKVNATFTPGTISAILGPHACGKSTLLACIAGQESLSSGHLYVDSRPLNALSRTEIEALRGRSIGFVSRRDHLIPSLDVRENITFHADMSDSDYDEQRLLQLVKAFDLEPIATAHPSQLSLQQRYDICLARELLLDPPFLLLDEPGQDPQEPHLQRLMHFLRRDNAKSHRTIIFTTSQPALAALADEVFFMSDGRLVAHMNQPTSSAVSEAFGLLDDWKPAVAFRAIKDLLSPTELFDYFGESPAPAPDHEQVWDQTNATQGAGTTKDLWPAMPENLRQRLKEIRSTESPQQPEPADVPLSQQEPPPGLAHLTGKQKPDTGIDIAALSQLLATSIPTHTPTPQAPSRIIPLDDAPSEPASSEPAAEPAPAEPVPSEPAPSEPTAEAEDTHEDDLQQPESLADINQHIVRMKARLRAMAEQAERRLNSMEEISHIEPEQTPPQPVKRSEPSRMDYFRQNDDERWKRLMSTFAPTPEQEAAVEEEKREKPEEKSEQLKQIERREQLMHMMQKAQALLTQSDSELKEVRNELDQSS